MTPEEIQRMMDFILQSQADSVTRMDRLEKDQRRLLRQQAASRRDLDTLVSVTRDLVQVSRQTVRRVQDLESR
jgi:hypothetical protein